jgi:glycosyltransferase involved in cell wall biosynthesis
MPPYSVVIPTRNREVLLNKLLANIDFKDPDLVEVIVVDSSDTPIKSFANQIEIKYIHTSIKSAATQRNIGIDNLKEMKQNIFFVDDDVILPENYFYQLNECLSDETTIGASGLAINHSNDDIRIKPEGISGLYRRIFLLDSKRDGVLLRSAINIPVRYKKDSLNSVIDTEWLIGCSAWKSTIFTEFRFEDKFMGQSLGEDILFSSKSKKKGKLMVDTKIIIDHLESEIERPSLGNFYKMWISNRYEISKQLHLSWFNTAFHWANLGKCIITIIRWDLDKGSKRSIMKGIILGYYELIFGLK